MKALNIFQFVNTVSLRCTLIEIIQWQQCETFAIAATTSGWNLVWGHHSAVHSVVREELKEEGEY